MTNPDSFDTQAIKQPETANLEDSNEFQLLKTIIISSAHAIHDTYSGFISPLIPFLIADLSLLKVEASLFSFVFSGISILQPLIGHLADRYDLRKAALFAPAVSGIFLSLLGTIPNLQTGLIYCLIAGISSATMHSILPVLVSSYSGKEIGKGMSYWMVAGDIGIMIAPLIITAVITTFSTSALPWLMIGGIVISLLLNFLLKDEPYVKSNNGEHKPIPTKDLLAIMLPLAGIISMRSILRNSTTIYLSVYLIENGANVWLAGSALSIVQAFGAIGIILGGFAKDRYGFKPAMMFSVLCSSAGMLLFVFSSGALQIVSLALLGISLMMILPVAMATVQENFKENRSLANGIYLALLFAINALTGILTGFLYDQFGGFTTFLVGGLLSFLGIPFVFMLPSYEKEAEA